MKVAFWNGSDQNNNVTANLAAVSIAIAYSYPYKILTLENYLTSNNLSSIFKNPSEPILNESACQYYIGSRQENLISKLSKRESCFLESSYVKVLIRDRLYYLSQETSANDQLFDYEFNNNRIELLEIIKNHTDLCLIDTANKNSLSTKHILEDSDLIVVNLSQNLKDIKTTFLNSPSLIKKSIFIINESSRTSEVTDYILSKRHNIAINKIITFPYNETYLYYLYRGDLIEFIISNLKCNETNSNFKFINSLMKVVELINDHIIKGSI